MTSLLRMLTERLQDMSWRFGLPNAAHMTTARRGELQAYLYLRELGYRIVERNLRQRGQHGEIDLIGWDDKTLCFIEVKTRTGESAVPPEAAVDRAKQQHLRAVARRYLRKPGGSLAQSARFDIVSVTYAEDGQKPDVRLTKNAFGWRPRPNQSRM